MTHRNSILLSFSAVVIMLILYTLSALGYMGANPVGQTGSYSNPLIVPAGYAFAIWSIIYTGIIAFPIFQWFKRQEGHPLLEQVRIWFSINAVGNGLWLAVSSYNFLWTSVIVILIMLFTLYKMNDLFIRIRRDNGEVSFWGEQLVISLYFAWITLASVLNVSSALHFYNWEGFGISQEVWTMIMLPIAAIIGGLVSWKYKNRAYAGVVIWAFVALIVRHLDVLPMIAYISGAVVITFVFLIGIISKTLTTTSA